MSELSKQNSIHESECQLLCNKIKSLNLLLGEKRCSLEQVKNEKMLPRDTSFTTNPQQGVSVGDTLPSLSPCNIDSEKPETDSCAISPLRKVPRFMSPTASSRGKKSPIVLCDHPMMTQQPPMTFTSGYSKRIVAPRGVLTDSPRTGLKIDTRNDITNSKRKLMERSPWPATAKKPDQSADNSVCTTTSEGPVDKTFGIKETPTPTKFTELPTNDVLTPISHSKVTEEHYSRILAAERSISKLAVSVSSSVRGSSPRSRRRLSLDCSSMNGTTKRFVF